MPFAVCCCCSSDNTPHRPSIRSFAMRFGSSASHIKTDRSTSPLPIASVVARLFCWRATAGDPHTHSKAHHMWAYGIHAHNMCLPVTTDFVILFFFILFYFLFSEMSCGIYSYTINVLKTLCVCENCTGARKSANRE